MKKSYFQNIQDFVPQIFRCVVTTREFRLDIRRNGKYALIQKLRISVTWEAVADGRWLPEVVSLLWFSFFMTL